MINNPGVKSSDFYFAILIVLVIASAQFLGKLDETFLDAVKYIVGVYFGYVSVRTVNKVVGAVTELKKEESLAREE